MLRVLITALFFILLPAAAMALPEVGTPAPEFTTSDIEGKQVKLADFRGSIVVLEWNNPGCPFVHKHYDSGNMQKLQAYATGKKVVWLTINSGGAGLQGNMTTEQAKAYVTEKKLASTHYILDPYGTIGHQYGAKTTPHMFVINDRGLIAYMGAIDDKPTPDPASLEGATNYVKIAIDNLQGNVPIPITSTQAYGCSVKYAE